MRFIAGRYVGTWNSLAMGQTEDGLRLQWTTMARAITGDAWAETEQDEVLRGANMQIAFNLIEYTKAAVQTAMWPLHATLFNIGVVGRTSVQNAVAKPLVMTAVTGTPAQIAAAPASLTFPLTKLMKGFPVELLFAPDLRTVPLRMQIFPGGGVDDDATGIFGTQT